MEYRTHITPLMRAVNDVLINECIGVPLCLVQHPRNLVVEVPKSDMPEVIASLKKHFPDVVDIRKAYPMMEELHDFILVKPIISEAPLYYEDSIAVPTVEKMMVDCMADKEYPSADTKHLFQRAMEQYHVNTSRLLRYASRKGKKEETMAVLGGIDHGRIATISAIGTVLSSAPVLRAWVFGSYARMEERPDSDIDLLVTMDKTVPIGLLDFSELVSKLEAATGRPIDLVPEDALKPFARATAERDKVLVYERAG